MNNQPTPKQNPNCNRHNITCSNYKCTATPNTKNDINVKTADEIIAQHNKEFGTNYN